MEWSAQPCGVWWKSHWGSRALCFVIDQMNRKGSRGTRGLGFNACLLGVLWTPNFVMHAYDITISCQSRWMHQEVLSYMGHDDEVVRGYSNSFDHQTSHRRSSSFTSNATRLKSNRNLTNTANGSSIGLRFKIAPSCLSHSIDVVHCSMGYQLTHLCCDR